MLTIEANERIEEGNLIHELNLVPSLYVISDLELKSNMYKIKFKTDNIEVVKKMLKKSLEKFNIVEISR